MKYAGKNAFFWRKDKLDLLLPFASSYDQSQLQPRNLNYVESWKIPLHMQSICGTCVYVLACATYVPSISKLHTLVLTREMQVHQCLYIYIYYTLHGYCHILNMYAPWMCWYSIWLWHVQQPCCLYHKELLRHQYPLEECYWFDIYIYVRVYILYSCSKVMIHYQIWNYFLTRHIHLARPSG